MNARAKQNNRHSRGMGNGTISRRNERRRDEELRQRERAERSSVEQIGRLDAGGFAAIKERTRLMKQIGRRR